MIASGPSTPLWAASTSCPQVFQSVDARCFDAFWLWAGVHSQPVLAQARRLYLLQGEVRPGAANLIAQRAAPPHVPRQTEVWMVVRVDTLRWTPAIHEQVRQALDRWREAGNRVVGVQIDFDARTRHLGEYAQFLADLRRRLPADCKLGITGLLDWSSHGDPQALNQLAGVLDETVLQIYQGRRVIPGYDRYLAQLGRLTVPFRIGLLQGGPWQPPPRLRSLPQFRGYVVFLVNPPPPAQ